MRKSERAFGLLKVTFRVGYHIAAALMTAADSVEEDIRVHVLREPRGYNDTIQTQVQREADQIRASGNDYAPVSVSDII